MGEKSHVLIYGWTDVVLVTVLSAVKRHHDKAALLKESNVSAGFL